MARDGMGNLIQRVRLLANANTDEWTYGTRTYWTDDLIEDQLDLHRVEYVEQASAIPVNVGGSTAYHDYKLSHGYLEEAESGTANWSIRDSAGTLAGTAGYSTNYEAGLITFTADTRGTTMTVRYNTYDVFAAAADIWRTRASNVALYYDIREGEHSLSRSQMFDHCMQQATIMNSKSNVADSGMTRMFRSDLN